MFICSKRLVTFFLACYSENALENNEMLTLDPLISFRKHNPYPIGVDPVC